jgi:RHH-type transcriptional regulator, rel operon repressor / antitoxin RelB
MLAVRLPQTLEIRLNALSKRTHRSKSYYVKKALEALLEEQEEIQEAVAAYEEFLASGRKGLALEEMKRKYGFEPYTQLR